MSPEAQRIAIAEACGWRFENYGTREFPNLYWRVFNPDGKLIEKDFTGADFRAVYVPDYLNDRNAMHEAVHKWLESAQSQYIRAEMEEMLAHQIRKILKFQHATFTATAAQLAEAYLRTLNIWNPGA